MQSSKLAIKMVATGYKTENKPEVKKPVKKGE